MHAQITGDQARALAMLVHTLRPEWGVPGIAAAIYAAKDKAGTEQVIMAAVRLARRHDLRSPAVLAEDGPHWSVDRSEGLDTDKFARCTKPGHQSYPAWKCGACRSEEIARRDDERVAALEDDDTEAYARGAELARKSIAAARATRADHLAGEHATPADDCPMCLRAPDAPTAPDARSRAAGEREDEDS